MSGGHYPPSYQIQSQQDFIAPRHKLPAIPPQRPTTSTISHAHSSPWINKHNFPHFENAAYYPRNFTPVVRTRNENTWPEFRGMPMDKLDSKIHNIYDKDEQQESMDLSSVAHVPTIKSLKEPVPVNGDPTDKSENSIINGAEESKKKEAVSVIAPNPLRESVVKTQPVIKTKYENLAKVKSEPIAPDRVESILETMFHSDIKSSVTSTTSSVIVTAQSCKPQTDLRAESVEKILKSPTPECFDSALDSLDSDKSDSELIISCEESSSVSNTKEDSANDSKSNTIIDTNQETSSRLESESNTRLEPEAQEKVDLSAEKCDKPKSTSKKFKESDKQNRSEEITYVEVESELEKMFAGIEEAHQVNETDVDSLNANTETSATENNRTDVSRRDSGKHTKKKSSKKSKSAPVKKEPKKHSSSKETAEVIFKRVPVIHVEGSKENPISVQIINSIKLEEDEVSDGKLAAKRKGKCDRATKRLATPYTLKNYDPDTSDESWICIFCKLCAYSPGIAGEPTGDLFGPYFIKNPNETVERHSRKSNDDHLSEQVKKKQKRSLSSENDLNDINSTEHRMHEIWAHENCFVWASGIHLVGSKLVGLEEAVLEAQKTTCFHCGEKGASIGCRARHCNSYVHYSCALFTGWKLDPETFITTCHLHKGTL